MYGKRWLHLCPTVGNQRGAGGAVCGLATHASGAATGENGANPRSVEWRGSHATAGDWDVAAKRATAAATARGVGREGYPRGCPIFVRVVSVCGMC